MLHLYETKDVDETHCGRHFMTGVRQIITLSTLNLYSVACQLHLNKTGREKHTPVFTAARCTTAKCGNNPSVHRQMMDKHNVVAPPPPPRSVEQCSTTKRKEVLTHGTTGTSLENTLVSERSQTQKATYCTHPFRGNSQNNKSTEAEVA